MNPFKTVAHELDWPVKARGLLTHMKVFTFCRFLFFYFSREMERVKIIILKILRLGLYHHPEMTFGRTISNLLFPWVKAMETAIAAVCVRENFRMYLT